MKRLTMCFVVAICMLFSVVLFAQAEETIPTPATPIISTIVDDLNLILEADVLINLRGGGVIGGLSMPLAEGWDHLVEIRFVIGSDLKDEEDDVLGLGLSGDPIKLISGYLPDWSWTANIYPRLGIVGIPNSDDGEFNSINDIDFYGSINMITRGF